MFSKSDLLEKAVEIAKEYARSGTNVSLEVVLERVYNKLKELADADKILSD